MRIRITSNENAVFEKEGTQQALHEPVAGGKHGRPAENAEEGFADI